MRSLKFVLVLFCFFATLGCYEVNEEIAINDDGSGVYNTKMDMSQLIDMMQTFAGEEKMAEQGMDRAIDTVINFQSIIDSAKEMTGEQKELMKNAKMRMQMNIKEKLFKIDINVPYKNYASLEKLLAGGGATGSAMSEAMKDLFSEKKSEENTDITTADSSSAEMKQDLGSGMNDFTNFYDVTVNKGVISRKVNQEKWKAITDKPEMQQMKQLSSSGMEILYTTTIRLPRPVKKSDNAMFKMSDDRKTITMKYNMLEMLDNPDKFSYTIEY